MRHLGPDLACQPLRPGELVTTGTLTEAMPAIPGQNWTTRLAGIDIAGLRLRLRQPHYFRRHACGRSRFKTLTVIQPFCAPAVLAMLPPNQAMEAPMLTSWISPDALKSLNDGFVVAIMLEAKEGQADALAEILQVMTPPTMAEPGVKLFLSYRSPTNPLLFFVFELYVNEAAWGAHEATDHFKTAVAQLLPRVTRRERVPFIPFLPN
jgi:quinol monooxygenase YgiN